MEYLLIDASFGSDYSKVIDAPDDSEAIAQARQIALRDRPRSYLLFNPLVEFSGEDGLVAQL